MTYITHHIFQNSVFAKYASTSAMRRTIKLARRRKRTSTGRHRLPPISVLGIICIILLVVPTGRAHTSRSENDKGSSEDGGVISSRAYHEEPTEEQTHKPLDRGSDVQRSQSNRVAIIGKSCLDTFIHNAGLIIVTCARENHANSFQEAASAAYPPRIS
jgi:hypothetical protein